MGIEQPFVLPEIDDVSGIYRCYLHTLHTECLWCKQHARGNPESGFNMNDAMSSITLSGRQSMLHSLPVSLSLGSVALKSEKWKIMDAAAAQAKYDK